MKYERTVCACAQCRACCKTMPGNLVPGDLENLMDTLGVDPDKADEFIADKLRASEGALVLVRGRLLRIPTLVPAQRPDGACVFLDGDELCTVHAVAPFGCRMFTVHMSRQESDPIVHWGLHRIIEDAQLAASGYDSDVDREHDCVVGFYGAALDLLTGIGKSAAPLNERKAALRAALDNMEG